MTERAHEQRLEGFKVHDSQLVIKQLQSKNSVHVSGAVNEVHRPIELQQTKEKNSSWPSLCTWTASLQCYDPPEV